MSRQRTLSAAEQAHFNRAVEYIDQAAQHHEAATVAHDNADDRALAAAHRSLGRCLRSAQQCFRDLAAAAAAADITNTQTVQTSSGTRPSTGSADGRSSPLLHGDIEGWLARARVGAHHA